jgi:uncharacterized protein (TIGR03086 family)
MSATTADLAGVIDKTTLLLARTGRDQRALPTPCPEFDVATLSDHMVGWLRVFAARAAGTDYDEDPLTYRCGADPAAEFATAGTMAVAAFRTGAADRPLRVMSADLPGSVVLGMMLVEYIGHGWDLATATGQPVPYTEDEAGAALTSAQGMLTPDYRGPGQSFGHEIQVGADAPTVDRLIAFIGRTPAHP